MPNLLEPGDILDGRAELDSQASTSTVRKDCELLANPTPEQGKLEAESKSESYNKLAGKDFEANTCQFRI